MARDKTRGKEKNVLFLCTGNYYRSRFAEILFNSVAVRLGLPWRATSRALALERGIKNVGPLAASAISALEGLGVRRDAEWSRMPAQLTVADLEQADRIIALKQAEHLPLLEERFPSWAEKVEFWHIEDAPGVLPEIEREVMELTARLLGGGLSPAVESVPAPSAESKKEKPRPAPVVRIGRETKGRRGKGVTIISDLPLEEAELQELAARLKNRCGTGGTVREGKIEIQGDQRERLTAELEGLGYKVKRVGG